MKSVSSQVKRNKKREAFYLLFGILAMATLLGFAILMLAFKFKAEKNSDDCFVSSLVTYSALDPDFYEYMERNGLTDPKKSAFMKSRKARDRSLSIITRRDGSHGQSPEVFTEIAKKADECKLHSHASFKNWIIRKIMDKLK